MSQRVATAWFLLLALPLAVAHGQEAPERLLPASTQVYVRWDGIEPHRAAFDKTALGKMMKDDTGKFLTSLVNDLRDGLGTLLTVPQLLEGVPPEKIKQMQADVAELPKLLPQLGASGLIFALEVRSVDPPSGQLTLILPNAGGQPGPFLALMRVLTNLGKADVKEVKLAGRTVYHLAAEPVHLVWWIDNKDAVLVVGTDRPEAVLKRAHDKTGRLAEHPEFKKLQQFKEFETGLRGFVDGTSLVRVVRTLSKDAAKIIDELGLDGLKAIRVWTGFDGPADRSLVEIDIPGPRKGLLQLANSKPFKLSDLPPIAPDVSGFSASRFDLANVYDVALKSAEVVVGVLAPDELQALRDAIKQADQVLGINIRKDLLNNLGDLVVTYSSPAEGPLSLGTIILVRVKDGKKLQAALDQMLKSLGGLAGGNMQVKKRDYRGAVIHEIHIGLPGMPFLPAYTIHDGWLAVSFFPQPLQGFVLRSKGELPSWKPTPELKAVFDKMPAEFTGVSVSDPRPSLKTILSLAPLVARLITSLAGTEAKFDVGALPNAHEATRHLFPNVSVATDDGNTLRIRGHASLAIPDVTGIDSYFLAIFLSFAARF